MKKSFVLYTDQYDPIRSLTIEQKGMLFDAIFKFNCEEDITFSDNVVEMAFSFFKQTFARDHNKYIQRCEKNRENINKRWNTNEYERIERNKSNTKHTDSDSVSGNILSGKPDIISKDVKKIISYLNKKTNANYKPTTKKTVQTINARLKEGFDPEDFKTVIDTKHEEWFSNPEMQQFLRPETLFGTKFESYLNQKPRKKEVIVYTNLPTS